MLMMSISENSKNNTIFRAMKETWGPNTEENKESKYIK